ncbi:hypothetical protein DL766_001625 [Monosporascus sp. MC13-8B]|uniref:G domain-containing protein n=1 Tax=Monosporascus cannonballus TaxID=155416 RepID=A0ABY0HEN9_9PEZI|nr:hypothetical protein DL762_002471 [Monosporascus cannonballus]RYO98947.1 hypothetical protein DL763_001857 [Monosporascus cannonballus]RYP37156.1 hypothetical protein DL766_001625 [Monosporascus sp. MC13-8B]
MSNRTPTPPMSSTSSPPVVTPSSTIFNFGEQRASSQSFTFGAQTASNPTFSEEHASTPSFISEGQSRSNRVSPAPSSAASGTPRFASSSSTPFTFGEERASTPSFTFPDDHDPDRPLPSVERDVSSTSSRQSTPSTTLYTPSTSTHADLTRQAPDQDAVLQQIGDLRNLRLTSPRTPGGSSSQRGTPTPSIHVTPSAPPNESSQPRASGTDSLVGGVTALHIESLHADSPGAPGLRESRSPSPSRRRRSGSGINRDSHQIENEDPPQALFHMPEVQEALASARTLTSRMANVLSSSNLHLENGSTIESLHQRATRLNGFQLPSSRIVGLVGDSGVGKSSLINSLLDKMELARASSSGTACTCAVTEYLFHNRDDFIIQVDYFPLDELKRQFEELLRAYRDYQSLPGNSRGRDEDDEDDNNRRRLQRKADLAKGTLRASFKERLEQTPSVLSSMPFEHAVETMVEWASQLLPRQGGQESFRTVEGCSARLRELSSESDDSLPNGGSRPCWPFIQKLRVYLKAYILSKGLIITDLPGLRDLNSARKAITERYVRQCHQILVVAKIDRAITDESIKEIFELASRANLSNIDVICTRSEEIQMQEARHDWPAERATIEEMQKEIDADTDEIDSLREEIVEYEQDLTNLTQEEERELMRLRRDCHRAERSRETHKFELLRHIVELRNDKVSDRLREEYRNYPIARTMKTFCVSNKLYWENRGKPATAALPYLKLSGILELRRYCIGIVAESRLRATREFIRDEIPAFLGSVELWVDAGSSNASAERRQRILDAVSAVQRELDELKSPVSQLNNVSRTLGEEFNSQIHLRMGQSGPQWTVDARRASLYWQGWSHPSYTAFCSNYGEHSTAKMGYHCWNEEAMEGMKGDMSAVWDSFAVNLEAHLERINGAVVQAFDNALRAALSTGANEHGAANNTRSAMQSLAATLCHRKDLTLYGIEEASESFHSELSSLHTDAFSSIRTAFIGKLMENTYHAANMEYGSGSDRRRKALITGKFGSPSLFNDHRHDCKAKFRDIARRLQDKVNEIVNHQVGLIEADLRMLRDENVMLESERDPEFRMRVGAEEEVSNLWAEFGSKQKSQFTVRRLIAAAGEYAPA